MLPPRLAANARRRLLLGIRAAAASAGALVVGGDVATARAPLVVTVAAVGHCSARVLTRAGARAGDALHVTAPLGGSRSGHHLDFRPPLRAGTWLAQRGSPVTAAIDVSDGLLLDLQTMLEASGGLGAELFAESIPVSAAARARARGDRAAALRAALGDGEDHCLLFAVAGDQRLAPGGPLTAAARRPIGRVLARPGLWLTTADGGRRRLPPAGWQHAVVPG